MKIKPLVADASVLCVAVLTFSIVLHEGDIASIKITGSSINLEFDIDPSAFLG